MSDDADSFTNSCSRVLKRLRSRVLDIIEWGVSEGKIPTFSIRGISSHYNRFLDIIGWGLYSGQSHIRYEKCSGICNQHVDLLAFDTHTTGLGCSSVPPGVRKVLWNLQSTRRFVSFRHTNDGTRMLVASTMCTKILLDLQSTRRCLAFKRGVADARCEAPHLVSLLQRCVLDEKVG
jgi:hypothetical protein